MNKLAKALAVIIATVSTERREDRGATAVEYALVIGLVSLVVVAAVVLFNGKVDGLISGVTFS